MLLIWPFALSPAVAGTIFLFAFSPQVGIVNEFLGAVLGVRPRWLDNPPLTFGLVTAAAIWKNLGYNVVFYLAALRNIPSELGEAAQLDGAGPLARFWRVTFPLLSPMTFFLVFTNLTFAFFDSFGLIDVMTAGGPVGAAPLDETGVTTTNNIANVIQTVLAAQLVTRGGILDSATQDAKPAVTNGRK